MTLGAVEVEEEERWRMLKVMMTDSKSRMARAR